jgi:aldehyde:ferredoxin oxidoreductase
MANGYAGRFLRVDLTEGLCSPFTVEDVLLRKFIGGSSLGAKLYIDGFPLEADPLAPESPLMVMTGPMVGSGFPDLGRIGLRRELRAGAEEGGL